MGFSGKFLRCNSGPDWKGQLDLTSNRRFLPIRSQSFTGFVLAGGASRRMGRSKAMILIEGETLLARQVWLARSVCRRVVVVGGRTKNLRSLDVPVVPDVVAGRGPIAGIYTALLETRTDFNLVLGCDMPFINRRLIGYLAKRAICSASDVTVPRSREGRLQPLCAVYRRRALYAIRTRLAAGENRPRRFFPNVDCTIIPWTQFDLAGFQPSIFCNMNGPEDYEYARRRLEGSTMKSA